MNYFLDPTATDRQTVDRVEMTALLKTVMDDDNSFFPGNEMTDELGRLPSFLSDPEARVDLIIVNDILTDVELFGRKRSDFSSLRDCVYSHLVEMGRGGVDIGQYFKD